MKENETAIEQVLNMLTVMEYDLQTLNHIAQAAIGDEKFLSWKLRVNNETGCSQLVVMYRKYHSWTDPRLTSDHEILVTL